MNKDKFLAIQDNKVLGVFDTRDEAHARVIAEQRRDLLWIIIKRKLAKLIYKGKADYPSTVYYIAQVSEVVENGFF